VPGRRPTRPLPALAAAAAIVVLAACGGDDGPSTQRYCDVVRTESPTLNTPAISTPADIEATLALYRRIADAAPLSVEVEWTTLVLDLETASTVVPSDQASVQKAADTARASLQAAERVQTFTHDVCGVDLGTPPTTVAVTVPSTTTKPATTGRGK
jgi:hypothetical protein